MSEDIDQLLSAYLDGVLSETESARVEQMVAADPAIAELLDRLAANDQSLRAAMGEGIEEEADAETLRRFGLGQPKVPNDRVANDQAAAHALARSANDNKRFWWPAAAAIAASAALFIIARPATPLDPWATPEFSRALDATPSLQTASLPGGTSLSPKLTFFAGDGRYCREFSLRAADSAQSRDGIACRDRGDHWHAVALVHASGAASPPSRIDVAQGSGEQLDAAYARLHPTDPFSADQERALIARNWARSK